MINSYINTLLIVLFATSFSFAQCLEDRHSTTWYDGWISCDSTDSPNPIRGKTHFIKYELDDIYYLYEMNIWNMNAPDLLNFGLKDVIVDISNDGTNWTEFGEFTFNKATGKNDYEGEEGFSFEGKKAKFVLITALSNYGDTCYGLSEIRLRARDICQSTMITWNGGTGDWNIASNWCGNVVPTALDSVWIPPYQTVYVPIAYTAEALWLDVDANSLLEINGVLNIVGN